MKLLCSVLLLFLFASCAFAQASPDKSVSPDVTIVPKKWRIDVRNPALDRNPVADMQARQAADQMRRETERTSEMMVEQGMPAPTRQVPDANRSARRRGMITTYVYEAKVSNNGNKAIRTLIWDYVFFEPGTENEVGRRRFVSKVNIGPGKKTDLVVRSLAAPTSAVDARHAGKKPQEQYSEKTVLQSVYFADGSMWRLPSN